VSATLLVIQGADQGRQFEVPEPPAWIGRGASNEVRVLDTEVSRSHALLAQTERGEWLLRDAGSSNGTFVNGQPIKEQILFNGDQVQIGRTILLFRQTAATGAKRRVAEQINLLRQEDDGDRSRIVSQLPASKLVAPVRPQVGANLQLLYRISEEAVRPSVPLDQLLQRILDLTLQVLGADRGCMLVADSKTDRIEPRVIGHRPGVDVTQKMPISTSIVEYVIRHGIGVLTTDAQHDSRFNDGHSILQAGIREAMCVPMQGRYELMGVIYVDTTTEGPAIPGRVLQRFNEELLNLLAAIGRQSALAVENNRYQESLVKAERLAAVGQTIATLSHHVKNILQGVRGGSYLIEMGLKEEKTDLIRRGWGILERNQDRIYNLVMDMLTFSKERQPKLELADVNQTVGEVVELMQVRAEELTIRFEYVADPQMPKSQFDSEGIHRAVLNLVSNAFDALNGRADGIVRVATSFDRERNQVFVEVADNGPGIDPVELPRLFNVFESTKGGKGTGLGLAVTQKILREHGGEVNVETKLGVGCRFLLSWPLIEEDEDEAVDSRTMLPTGHEPGDGVDATLS
jgi:two-component system NtrC family sensor kinase